MKKIKMLISDVDGVWTDGTFYKGTDGMELKRFTVLDGVGTVSYTHLTLPTICSV